MKKYSKIFIIAVVICMIITYSMSILAVVANEEDSLFEEKSNSSTLESTLINQNEVNSLNEFPDITQIIKIDYTISNDKIQYILSADREIKGYKVSNTEDNLIINIEDSICLLNSRYEYTDDKMPVEKINTTQSSYDPYISTIIFELKYKANDYDVKLSSNSKQLIIEMDYIEGIVGPVYEKNNNKSTIMFSKPSGVNIEDIVITDLYNDKKITIEIPGVHTNLFNYETLKINDSNVGNIKCEKNGNNTLITIEEKEIFAYNISENGNIVTLTLVPPKEKYSKIVVIDAGHGGSDSGAVGNGLVEKNLTLDITKYVKSYLDSSDIKAYYTRLEDTYPTLQERCDLANEIEADLFVSVHINSFTSSSANGTETYYSLSNNSNSYSSYLASRVQVNMVNELNTRNRGVKTAGFYVLNNTNMPAILAEVAFISNASDANILKQETNKKKAGRAVYTGIVEYFNKYPTGR